MFGAISGALICALSIGVGPITWLFGSASASQNQLSSPTTGTVSGLNLTNNFNNALDSLNTMNSGTSAPTNQLTNTPSAFNRWCNTTANPYPCNIYDGAQWLAPYYVDATNHLILNQVGGGTATIASATTTSLCSDPQFFITISGTTTITGFGTGCFVGQAKKIAFSGALTLTYNASSLIIPGAANVVTAAGDTADVVYLGSGNWQVTNYQPANGQALLNPAIDLGAVEWTFSPNVPSSKYLWGFGQAISRSTYSALMTALTITQSVTATNGSPTLTGFSDTTQIPIGSNHLVEASFVPAGTGVLSKTSTTVTLTANATASTTGNVTIFPFGDGDGTSTFNLPDCRGVVMAGRDNMGGTARGVLTASVFGGSQSFNAGTNPDSLGATGGNQNAVIATGNVPQFTFTPSGTIGGSQFLGNIIFGGSTQFTGAASNQFSAATSTTVQGSNFTFTGNSISIGSASPSAFPTVQPTITANCMIRVLAKLELLPLPGLPANDNRFATVERRRLAA